MPIKIKFKKEDFGINRPEKLIDLVNTIYNEINSGF